MKSARSPITLLLLAAFPMGAAGQEDPRDAAWKRRVENTFAFVLNPLGIQDALDVSWTKRINSSDAPLFKDAHVSAGVSSKLTPAFERLGAWFEYAPLSVIDLRVGVEPVYYFGTYKAFLPFGAASARFDDDIIEDRVDDAASGFANRFYFSPTLKAKVGSVVVRVRSDLAFWKAQEQGEPFFYEPAWDTLIKASGSTIVTLEALVLREIHLDETKTLLIGPVYDLTRVSNASINRKQDVGVVAVWSKSGSFHKLKDPTVAAKVVYFLEDPWRRHEIAAQFAFVFAF